MDKETMSTTSKKEHGKHFLLEKWSIVSSIISVITLVLIFGVIISPMVFTISDYFGLNKGSATVRANKSLSSLAVWQVNNAALVSNFKGPVLLKFWDVDLEGNTKESIKICADALYKMHNEMEWVPLLKGIQQSNINSVYFKFWKVEESSCGK